MNYFIKIALIVLAYLLGSIPFGLLIGKLKGIDIREHGSKNIGTTNVGRVLGRRYAFITYILDMVKGAIIVFLFRFEIIPSEYCLLSPMIYGLAAAFGHAFSIYIKFKGGKAVATSSGVIFGYVPWLLPVLLLIFALVVVVSRYVSLGSIIAAIAGLFLTIILFLIGLDPVNGLLIDIFFPIVCFLMLALIIYRHKDNINRIINNSERKVDL